MPQLRRFLALALLAFATPLAAGQLTSGDLTLHYSALPTTSLTAEVARQYGITRSGNRVLLNIALRRAVADADVAVAADVRASATNSAGQRQEIRLREVREGDAIYYLGEARVNDGETLGFEIEARVDDRPLQVRFQQQFFAPR
ncbi:DUF4426 domain-containing protein [Rehaibacterium terrae]|jgi:hypothetical protein|uniref:DUF4426 domain-containing protein n=1 Tax=Rehaibacterium terrae TaxID=1341696 RepID=A0A7W8DEW9_9GAMM|nr:DUF4426 domain-containing protein [Rehaibacterium terrae]MBB5015916.1 hypothetical protein [Rehaibacterium terrae]